MSSSIKESLSSETSSVGDALPQYSTASPPKYSSPPTSSSPQDGATVTACSSRRHGCHADVTLNASSPYYYPAATPGRRLFLTARCLILTLALLLFAVSFPAQFVCGRSRWMSAVLSPSISSWWCNGIDIYFVVRRGVRAHPLQRLLWDGALGLGFAISFGFMVSMTAPDIYRTSPSSTPASAAVGVVMLFLLFTLAILEFGISVDGGKQYILMRRARQAASNAAATV